MCVSACAQAHPREGGWFDASTYHLTEERFRRFVWRLAPRRFVLASAAAAVAGTLLCAVAMGLLYLEYTQREVSRVLVWLSRHSRHVCDGCCFRIRRPPDVSAADTASTPPHARLMHVTTDHRTPPFDSDSADHDNRPHRV